MIGLFKAKPLSHVFVPGILDCVQGKRWPQVLHPYHSFLRSRDSAFSDFLQDLRHFFASSFSVAGMVPSFERE
jgi:hypothetical protein